jgi:hypothetical protein
MLSGRLWDSFAMIITLKVRLVNPLTDMGFRNVAEVLISSNFS